MNCLEQLLETHDVLLVDGATGTELFRTNLQPGDAPERLNVLLPDIIVANHTGYIEAGSDIILTNSFGGTAYRLRLHDLDNQVFEINKAAAANARAAADAADRTVLVAGFDGAYRGASRADGLVDFRSSCRRVRITGERSGRRWSRHVVDRDDELTRGS